ncbi:unnamed protein product [Paramecium pentaurelia]|uniref:Uncharacterized protein n=1 Tax=Paramecium pentaurelia TaxID=43138 RepID=A0A8S1VFV8_9CILI|nr:unnamed protein product [Paramecium pentaurelia]
MNFWIQIKEDYKFIQCREQEILENQDRLFQQTGKIRHGGVQVPDTLQKKSYQEFYQQIVQNYTI